MHAWGTMTADECRETLTRLVNQWYPRSDWTVTFAAGYWHAANDEFEMTHQRLYEQAAAFWCEEFARRLDI